jgi:hypothetical protein
MKIKEKESFTIIKTSGLILGSSAAIKCLSSTLEKSPVYKTYFLRIEN